ncbi:O-succinylbenzoic acid-CoA ligase [Vibrio maritimus]|uniref:O-succinylbenzoic acid-CoA ligase n=1 Tax=Vibrio maritimus TaxID=990268 RepID=A0A090TU75_9VIBR|nr:O-succinylbenzoic acid-CoA ligase [Vibrio maritimus]
MTWRELCEHIQSLGQCLVEQELAPGDVVCLVGRAEQSLVLRYLACLAQGVIPALLSDQSKSQFITKFDTLYRTNEPANVWGNCQWDELTAQRDELELYRIERSDDDFSKAGSQPTNAIEMTEPVVSIVFTSGSTGRPKAVAHRASNHLASAEGLLQRFPFTADDSWLLSYPCSMSLGWPLFGAG